MTPTAKPDAPASPPGEPADPLDAEGWARLIAQVERAWPAEACGLVLASSSAARVAPLENQWPAGAEAGSGYRADPAQQLAQLVLAERQGERLVALYHSHPRGSAAFSEADRREALAPDGKPWWPQVDYLIVAVENGRAWEARAFRWNGAQFVGRRLALPAH